MTAKKWERAAHPRDERGRFDGEAQECSLCGAPLERGAKGGLMCSSPACAAWRGKP